MSARTYIEVRSSVFSAISGDNKKTFKAFKKELTCIKETFKKKLRVICLDRKIVLYNCIYILYTNIHPAPIEFQQNVPL